MSPAKKAYVVLLKIVAAFANGKLDDLPSDILSRLDAAHAAWHLELGTGWSKFR